METTFFFLKTCFEVLKNSSKNNICRSDVMHPHKLSRPNVTSYVRYEIDK
uniref:Uncharacterized protein n=1 Tax=Arundo donax TaxID=35708 RepID=A0A0A9CFM9_ARUDO